MHQFRASFTPENRLHSTIGYVPLVEWELCWHHQNLQAAQQDVRSAGESWSGFADTVVILMVTTHGSAKVGGLNPGGAKEGRSECLRITRGGGGGVPGSWLDG